MSYRNHYSAGVPCWVEILAPDVELATRFYGALFGWDFDGPVTMPGMQGGEYFIAQIDGQDVAGIGTAPDLSSISAHAWTTYVRVASVEATSLKALNNRGRVLLDPCDASPAGRLAILADPAGGVIGIWEAQNREGAQRVNESRAWALSTLRTTDTEGSKSFYASVFGWIPEAFGTQLTLWRLPGYVGGVPNQPVPRDVVGLMSVLSAGSSYGKSPGWSVDFWVDDADGSVAQAALLGGAVIVPAEDSPGFRSAILADPWGAIFSVSEVVT